MRGYGVGTLLAVGFSLAGAMSAWSATFMGLGEDIAYLGKTSANGRYVTGGRVLPPEQQPDCPPNAFCALATAPFRWTVSTGAQFIGTTDFRQGIAISQDGMSIAGEDRRFVPDERGPFIWTQSQGLVDLGQLPATPDAGDSVDISADGGVVVGGVGEHFFGTGVGGNPQAFRWTAELGMEGLGDLAGGAFRSFATAVSSDGNIVVGQATSSGDVGAQAFRWTRESGMVGLGFLEGLIQSTATDVSDDGGVVVGYGFGLLAPIRAFRWTESGMSELSFELAAAVTGDGNTIVGHDEDVAVIWDAVNGVRHLKQVLSDDFGLTEQLNGWELTAASDMSADGRTIVGLGVNPHGNWEAWVFSTISANPGDYNGDGIVDTADFVAWRHSLGQSGPNLPADGDGNGIVDQADYELWAQHFGGGAGSGSTHASIATPEPSTLLLACLIALAECLCKR